MAKVYAYEKNNTTTIIVNIIIVVDTINTATLTDLIDFIALLIVNTILYSK